MENSAFNGIMMENEASTSVELWSKKYGHILRLGPFHPTFRSSPVWRIFNLYDAIDSSGRHVTTARGTRVQVVRCRSCECGNDELLFANGSTSGMIAHVLKKHANSELAEVLRLRARDLRKRHDGNYVEDNIQKDLEDAPSPPRSKSVNTVLYAEDPLAPPRKRSKLSRESFVSEDEALLKFLVDCGLPLNTVDKRAFRQFCSTLNAAYKVPDRNFLAKDLFPEKVNEMEREQMNLLSILDHPVISLDVWNSTEADPSFLVIMAHGIHGDHAFYEAVMDVVCLTKTRGLSSEIVRKVLKMWNVSEDRVVAISSDSTAILKKLAAEMSVPWVPNLANRISFTVREILKKIPDFLPILAAVRANALAVYKSVTLRTKLEECQAALGLPHEQLERDVGSEADWRSILKLLSSAVNNFEAVNQLARLPESVAARNGQKRGRISKLSEDQLQKMNACLALLKPFEEVAKQASNCSGCISDYIPLVHGLRSVLRRQRCSEDASNYMRTAVQIAENIVQQCFFQGEDAESEIGDDILHNPVLLRAVYLHPRYCRTTVLSEVQWKEVVADIESELVARSCQGISREIKREPGFDGMNDSVAPTDQSVFSELQSLATYDSREVFSTQELEERNATRVKMQMHSYWDYIGALDADTRGMPVNEFWRVHQQQYPALAEYAREACGAPLGTLRNEFFKVLPSMLASARCEGSTCGAIRKMLVLRDWMRKENGHFSKDQFGYTGNLDNDDQIYVSDESDDESV